MEVLHLIRQLGRLASVFFSFVILCFSTVASDSAASKSRVALVYIGRGSCNDRCSEAAANIAKMAGLTPRFVTPEMINPTVFTDAVVWIQPGGNAIKASAAIGEKKLRLIRKFVHEGGGYVGLCAGAFLADTTVDSKDTVRGLGIIPWSTDYYPIDSGENGTLARITWRGKSRVLFFNGGGTFALDDSHPVKVIAKYEDGQPATIETTFGNGRLALTGAHPEALESWKTDAKLNDPDGSDWDLALEMLCDVLATGCSGTARP